MRRVTAVVLVSLLIGPIVASVLWNLDERLGIAIAGATLALVVLVLLGRLRAVVSGRTDADRGGSGDDGEGEGDGWSLVPDWQYEGRFAEAGGITRSEQEQAIREIDEQARHESDREQG
ncbi:hypothetical protein [Halobaculum magnesiiphilum]|uniref:Uncharacterized protein n=1 Tax=Halobaculum magnesiiphilum TaxID=1017351 RepID=A0A8T8WEA3_9EURY|nr:hypothetical protein [Halobaculum magnesiiphilum]QZP38171.1 hypothetical protein K6T50_03135 [Halobaculum magnesiiphilum]